MRFVIAVSVLMLAIAQAMADPADTNTGFPIYPGLGDPFALPNSKICGKVMQKAFIRVPPGKEIKTATMIAYYRAKLPASVRYFPAVIGGTSQDVFISGDGASEVTITGTPHSDDVYALSFGRFNPPLSAKQSVAFSSGKLAYD